MAFCKGCAFYNEEYDEMRHNYDDTIIKGETEQNHYCTMYDSNIPKDIFYGDGKCPYFIKTRTE